MGCLMGKEDVMGAAGQPGPRPYMQQQYGGYGGYGGYGNQQPYEQYAQGRPLCQSNEPGYMQQPYGYQGSMAYGDAPMGYGQGPPGPSGPPGPPGYGGYGYPPNPYQAPNGPNSYDGYEMEQGRQGMSNGGKMAMAAAGGLALGAGAALAIDHADDIAHFAEEAMEDIF